MSPFDNLSRNHYRLEENDKGPVLRLYEGEERKNAHIQVEIRDSLTPESFLRLNIPEEDREKLREYFEKFTVKNK